jgi:hypothetical protein
MEVLDREDEWLVSTVVQHELPQERKGATLLHDFLQPLAIHRHRG